jgi:hypothetical protein
MVEVRTGSKRGTQVRWLRIWCSVRSEDGGSLVRAANVSLGLNAVVGPLWLRRRNGIWISLIWFWLTLTLDGEPATNPYNGQDKTGQARASTNSFKRIWIEGPGFFCAKLFWCHVANRRRGGSGIAHGPFPCRPPQEPRFASHFFFPPNNNGPLGFSVWVPWNLILSSQLLLPS